MQKKKIVAGITAIVVLALLFAGVGYATFTGTARTYNQGDEQTLAYMAVTPDNFNAIFTDSTSGKTIFDTYDYYDSAKKRAYGFDGGESPAATDVTAYAKTYKAVKLNSTPRVLTISNETGDPITAVNITINAYNDANKIGSADFAYIFQLHVDGDDAANDKFIVFDGTSTTGVVEVTAAIANEASKNIDVTVYIGYVPNAYVPDNYVGNVKATQDTGYSHPYRTSTEGPVDLAATNFGITVTDAS